MPKKKAKDEIGPYNWKARIQALNRQDARALTNLEFRILHYFHADDSVSQWTCQVWRNISVQEIADHMGVTVQYVWEVLRVLRKDNQLVKHYDDKKRRKVWLLQGIKDECDAGQPPEKKEKKEKKGPRTAQKPLKKRGLFAEVLANNRGYNPRFGPQ